MMHVHPCPDASQFLNIQSLHLNFNQVRPISITFTKPATPSSPKARWMMSSTWLRVGPKRPDALLSTMRLMSWNVNGLRAVVKKGFTDQIEARDILGLQETQSPGRPSP